MVTADSSYGIHILQEKERSRSKHISFIFDGQRFSIQGPLNFEFNMWSWFYEDAKFNEDTFGTLHAVKTNTSFCILAFKLNMYLFKWEGELFGRGSSFLAAEQFQFGIALLQTSLSSNFRNSNHSKFCGKKNKKR